MLVLNLCGLLSRQAINSTLQLGKSRKPQEQRALVVWRFNARCTNRFQACTYSWILCMVLTSYRTKIPLNFSCLGKHKQFSPVWSVIYWHERLQVKECADCYLPDRYHANTIRSLIRRSLMDWWRTSILPRFQSARTVLSLRQRPHETSVRLFTVQSIAFCQSDLHHVCTSANEITAEPNLIEKIHKRPCSY